MMPYLVTGKRDVIGDITQSPRVAGDVAERIIFLSNKINLTLIPGKYGKEK